MKLLITLYGPDGEEVYSTQADHYHGTLDGYRLLIAPVEDGPLPRALRAAVIECDRCDQGAMWKVYAAYSHAPHAVHPEVAHYPAPMIRACNQHLAGALTADLGHGGATPYYLVEPCTSST